MSAAPSTMSASPLPSPGLQQAAQAPALSSTTRSQDDVQHLAAAPPGGETAAARPRAVTTPGVLNQERDEGGFDLPVAATPRATPELVTGAADGGAAGGATSSRSRSKTQPDAVLYASRERGESNASSQVPPPSPRELAKTATSSSSRATQGRDRADSRVSLATTATEVGADAGDDCVPAKRVKEWKKHFEASMREGEELVCTHGCALVVDIMLHGRIYISNRSVSFRSNIVGWITKRHFPLDEISRVEPRVVAGFIPNALAIIHKDGKETLLTTLPDREHTMRRLLDVWAEAAPEDYRKFKEQQKEEEEQQAAAEQQQQGDEKAAATDDAPESSSTAATKADTPDLEKQALTTTFAAAPDKIYSLMYHHPTFLSDIWKSQGFRDIEVGEWDEIKHRHSSYTKPIGGNVGSTTVENDEEIIHPDGQDDWYAVVGVTRTPNVPSGKSFSTKSKTVFTQTASGGTRMHCTYQIEWTGKSMLKGMINGQAEKGQIEWNKVLAERIREYVEQHPEERVGQEEEEQEEEQKGEQNVEVATAVQSSGNIVAEWLTEDPARGAMAIALLAIVGLYLWSSLASLFRAKTVCVPVDRWKAFEAYEAYERLKM